MNGSQTDAGLAHHPPDSFPFHVTPKGKVKAMRLAVGGIRWKQRRVFRGNGIRWKRLAGHRFATTERNGANKKQTIPRNDKAESRDQWVRLGVGVWRHSDATFDRSDAAAATAAGGGVLSIRRYRRHRRRSVSDCGRRPVRRSSGHRTAIRPRKK